MFVAPGEAVALGEADPSEARRRVFVAPGGAVALLEMPMHDGELILPKRCTMFVAAGGAVALLEMPMHAGELILPKRCARCSSRPAEPWRS